VYLASTRPIARFGLALEPKGLARWASAEQLMPLQSPRQLQLDQLADVGVVAYHLAFDECLTLGFNPRLAAVLGMSTLEVRRERRASDRMIGNIPTQSFASYCCIEEVFWHEEVRACNKSEVSRVAVVGAMTNALVREAVSRGADVYITGQLRQPKPPCLKPGLASSGRSSPVRGVGLRALAGVLCERWSRLEVILPPLSNFHDLKICLPHDHPKWINRRSHHLIGLLGCLTTESRQQQFEPVQFPRVWLYRQLRLLVVPLFLAIKLVFPKKALSCNPPESVSRYDLYRPTSSR